MEKKNEKLSAITIPEKDAKSSGKKSFWHINKRMLPFKLHFFLFVGGMGAVLPYQSALGITKLGLTASNLAAAYTAQQFLFTLFKPGIGYLADYFNKLKATIVVLTVLQAIFCFFMIIIPSVDVQSIIQGYESNVSINNLHHCHLCHLYDKFTLIPEMQSGYEENLSSCLNYSEKYENVIIQCSEQSCFHVTNISYHQQGECNASVQKDFSLPSNSATLPDESTSILFIILSINGSQNSSIVCFSSERIPSFLRINPSYNIMKQYCHRIPEYLSVQLQEQFHTSTFEVATCKNSTHRVRSHSKDEYNPALSSANFKTYQFWAFTVCLIASCTCISSIFTMSDTACHESVQTSGGDYGRQRAWGAVSWGLIAPFAGFINDYTESYLASWCLMCFLCSLQIWNLSRMNLVKPDSTESILKDLRTVFSSAEFIAFEAGVLMNGMFTGVIWFYLTWFLTTIGGNKLIIGLAHTVQCFFGEVPIMFVSGWMIKKLGHFNIVSLALLCHGIRFFIYSYLYNPWWILPVEAIHGFTFGSFYSSMTSYGKLNSKPGTEATTQSILCTTYEALGAGLGCVISGICFDRFGGHTTFFFASFVCAFATLINVVSTVLIKCRKGVLNITEKAVGERY